MQSTDRSSSNRGNMNGANAKDAVGFTELFPFLNPNGVASAEASAPNDLSDADLLELLQALDRQAQGEQVEELTSQEDTKERVHISTPEPTSMTRSPNETNSPAGTTRVRTYTARKREIERLLQELPHLESYVDYLKHRAAMAHNQTDSLGKTQLVNATLRESIYRQQYTLARLQSAMSFYRTRQERMIPMDTFVHLSHETEQRHRTVTVLRSRILRDAVRFIRERTWFVDHSKPSIEEVAFTGASDDRCAVKFCVSPVEGSPDVKQVFDALMFYISHTDIMMTEATGDVTTREDATDFTECEASQSRQVRLMANGYQVESNSLVYADFQTQDHDLGDGRALGIIVVTAVGQDDLYPFSPDSRLRKDLTTIMVVKTFARSDSELGDSAKKRAIKDNRSQYGVVMVRYSFLRVHRGSVEVSKRKLSDVCDRLLVEGNVLFDTVQASVDDTAPAEETSQRAFTNADVSAIGRVPPSADA